MVIGLCQILLRTPETFSLKDKRQITASLKSKIRSRYNLSVAETGQQKERRLAELSLAAVATGREQAHQLFMAVLRLVENDGRGEVVDFRIEWY